ncbi:MAG: hybrid non-ribosomal peptide synthetase/type I polyketide synthase, partial [Chloroflexi bacterium AL-N5]|nr:hybrid non-ribosomal peptide synthetase/type I polyketide synthase [Chloroflexi bacterium AL-N5]
MGNQRFGDDSLHSISYDRIESWLIQQIGTQLGLDVNDINVDEPFDVYGLSSRDLVTLSGDIEEWLHVTLSPTVAYEYVTIADLSQYLLKLLQETSSANVVEEDRSVLETPDTFSEEATDDYVDDHAIAVIGLGCRFPGASNVETFWKLLSTGVDAIRHISSQRQDTQITRFPKNGEHVQPIQEGGFLDYVDEFDPHFFNISPREAIRMDPQQRLLLEVVWESFENAGIDSKQLSGSSTGVFIGISTQEYSTLQFEDDTSVDVYAATGNASSIAANRLSYLFDLRGPSVAVDTACSSSLVAVHLACQSLRTGEASLALAGGVNVILDPDLTSAFATSGMLSPDARCKTFDASANGYVRGEGCGVVILKRLCDAQRDGDTIFAQIRGSAVNQDGRSNGLTAPNQSSQEEVIRRALAVAQVLPNQIQYVEAHGTGTELGDPIEMEALKRIYAQDRLHDQPCVIGSVKTNIGHLESAAGIAGLIKTILALRHQEIPSHLHLKNLNPHIDLTDVPFVIPTQPHSWLPGHNRRLAGISSFGFGGTNTHVIVEEAPPPLLSTPGRSWQLLTFSAKTSEACRQVVSRLAEYLEQPQDLGDVAYTLHVGRTRFKYGGMVVAHNEEEVAHLLRTPDAKRVLLDTQEPRLCKIVFLFSGQGSQYVRMGRDLYETEPVFHDIVDYCADTLRPYLDVDLRDIVYPSVGEEEPSQLLEQTAVAQPALFVIEYALAKLYQSWGIHPDVMIGHSIGEYVAACLSGVFTLDDALALVAQRGRLMQSVAPGSMLSVPLAEADIRPLLPDELSLAAINAPRRCVVSGPSEAIDSFSKRLMEDNILSRKLHTSHAFHSSMMDNIIDEFTSHVKKTQLQAPAIPYVSNVTGTWIDPQQATDPTYWADHLRRPVRFVDGLGLLTRGHAWTCLEVGPGQTLHSFTQQYAEYEGIKNWHILSSLRHPRSQQPDIPFLLTTLGKLWLIGHQIDWSAFYAGQRRQRVMLPNYPFERQRYWIQSTPQIDDRKEIASMSMSQEETNHNNTLRQDIELQVRDIISTLLQSSPDYIDLYTPFLEMGADSIVLVQAIRAIEQTFSVEITIRQIFEELTTIDDIVGYVEQQTPANWSYRAASSSITAGEQTTQQSITETAGMAASVGNMTVPALSFGSGNQPTADLQSMFAQQLNVLTQMTQVMAQQLAVVGGQVDSAPPLSEMPRSSSARAINQSTAVVRSNGNTEEKSSTQNTTFVPYQPIRAGSRFDPLSGLTDQQRQYLEDFTARYTQRTARSKQQTQSYRSVLADNRASVGFRFSTKELLYPIISDRSCGSHLWDIDGNEYIDLTMGFGVTLFGHQALFIHEAVRQQLEQGVQLGPQSDVAGEVATLIHELTGVERITFCNSGTEAVMMALRLARTTTGRSKIALFAGSYHGSSDGTLVVGESIDGASSSLPMSPGVTPGIEENVIVLEYGSAQAIDTVREHAHELAAVLVEPVQSRRPDLQPKEFLHELRALTAETDIALIFDEIITGFRIHPGGAQAWFDVQADMVTYGKIVGGGFPIGIVCGKAAYLDGIDGGLWQYGDLSYPSATTTFFAGTFCKHPLTMAASRAVLQHLKEAGPTLQEQLNARTTDLVKTLNQFFESESVPIRTVQFGSLFRFTFTTNMDLFFYHLVAKGLYIWEGRNLFLSTAHTDDDIAAIIRIVRESVMELREGGFLPEKPPSPTDPETPPDSADSPNGFKKKPKIADVNDNGTLSTVPLNDAQYQLWVATQLEDGALCAYNEALVLALRGSLSLQTLQYAIQHVVDRHEALRIVINSDGTSQQIFPSLTVDVLLVDFTTLQGEASHPSVQMWLSIEQQRPFDLTKGPLFRCTLLKLTDATYLLALTAHHVVVDGMSLTLLVQEVSAIYSTVMQGEEPQLETPISFRDFLTWQNQRVHDEAMRVHETYWLDQFARPVIPLDLLTAKPRPNTFSYIGGRQTIRLMESLHEKIKAISRTQHSTLFMTLHAVYAILLHRLSFQEELVVGIPITLRGMVSDRPLIGYTLNLLPIRSTFHATANFRDYLTNQKRVLIDAFEHSEYPLAWLLNRLNLPRDTSRPPLFNVTFNLDRVPDIPQMGDVDVQLVALPPQYSKFDISLNIVEFSNELYLECDYSTGLFEQTTIERMLEQFSILLAGIANDIDRPLHSVPLLSIEEQQQILVDWNNTVNDPCPNTTVTSLFERVCSHYPDACALATDTGILTYQALNQRANQLAYWLHSQGVHPDVPVAILLPHSLDLIIAYLAVLKAGGAYVPLDPNLPPSRISFILEDTGTCVLLTHAEYQPTYQPDHLVVHLMDTYQEALGNSAHDTPFVPLQPSHLAYIIYTSGSTGTPKGVSVSHAALINLVMWHQRVYQVTPQDRSTMVAGLGFDASVWELWPCLLAGGMIAIPDNDLRNDLSEMLAWFAAFQSTISFLPTPWLEAALTSHWEGHSQLRVVLTGGDILHKAPDRPLGFTLANNYGPTENTVVATWTAVSMDSVTLPPIGRPVDRVQTYVLDRWMTPVPVGVPGELYLGGASLARGYWHRYNLTADKFVPNHLSGLVGGRLYRTGDRVRYRFDGQLEFLGRLDQQVKIRGYRIELSEIEAILMRHPLVQDQMVVDFASAAGYKQLAAYIIWNKEEGALPDSSVGSELLQSYLREYLPDYMIPVAFVTLTHFPLTPNGKIDRRALPYPDEESFLHNTVYAAPRTLVEQQLANIWQQVLQIDPIGIHDNFFAIGGDSILVIQVASRAKQLGLAVAPRQIFQHQTIAELALVAGTADEVIAEQGAIVGPTNLTPIQHMFLSNPGPHPHHYNQTLLLKVGMPLSHTRLAAAITAVINHHDALRLRFTLVSSKWAAAYDESVTKDIPLIQIDLSRIPTEQYTSIIDRISQDAQASLDLTNGPLLRVVYFETDSDTTRRLLIVIHHLVVDGVSWRILLEDIQRGLLQGTEPYGIQLPPKTTSFHTWSHCLRDYTKSDHLMAELPYWTEVVTAPTSLLPRDYPEVTSELTQANMADVIVALDAEETRALLQDVPGAYNTQINDVLLTAFTQSLTRWSGGTRMRIALEGHGRSTIFDHVDLTRTVGWFTSLYPISLDIGQSSDIGEQLCAVKEQLRAVPHDGLGYGILRYLASADVASVIANAPLPEVVFNYLGQLDSSFSDDGTMWSMVNDPKGSDISDQTPVRHLLEVNSQVLDGKLVLTWSYNTLVHTSPTIKQVADNFLEALRGLILHCTHGTAGMYTPSDFPLVSLKQAEITHLVSNASGVSGRAAKAVIEDIYPLAPLQEGILFHTLYAPEGGLYFQQFVLSLGDTIDIVALRSAWEYVVQHFAIIRTAFMWEKLPAPAQVVFTKVSLPWELLDWQDVPASEQMTHLEQWLKQDQARGFDLTCPPLMRITLIRFAASHYTMVWSYHHLLLDGWSIPIVMEDLLNVYKLYSRQQSPVFESTPPYRNYIAWIKQQDRDAASSFWREYLADFTDPTVLGIDGAPGMLDQTAEDICIEHLVFPVETTSMLDQQCRANQVTLNVLVQSAWAFLLSCYSGTNDVVFGSTVSGRPGALPEVEHIVGLFINTIPVRVRIPLRTARGRWLQQIQQQQTTLLNYDYLPLAQVQNASEVTPGIPLFETLIVFENYPVDMSLFATQETFVVNDISLQEQTNYPLTLTIHPGTSLDIQIEYNQQRFDQVSITRLLEHLRRIITQVALSPNASVASIDLLSDEERQQVVVDWNATARQWERPQRVADRIGGYALTQPDAVALVDQDLHLTYACLVGRASHLAHALRQQGVGPETCVAVCLPRSLDLFVAVLAVWLADGAYLPLDPTYPPQRLATMLTLATPHLLLTATTVQAVLPASPVSRLWLDQHAWDAPVAPLPPPTAPPNA